MTASETANKALEAFLAEKFEVGGRDTVKVYYDHLPQYGYRIGEIFGEISVGSDRHGFSYQRAGGALAMALILGAEDFVLTWGLLSEDEVEFHEEAKDRLAHLVKLTLAPSASIVDKIC